MLFVSSKLDAVNTMLAAVGDSPVSSLTDHQSVDVYNAISMLDEVSRKIQSQGWQFNTLTEMTVKPDMASKRIRYNPTWISFVSTDGNVYVKRGDFLYDITNKTYNFENDVIATIIEAVDYEDLPDCFKTYITSKAAIKFQSRYLGDDNISQMLVAESNEAYADIVQYSIDTGTNMLQIPAVSQTLSRTGG